MSTNILESMSIFDFVDDIDAFIDEWYEFHEAVYQDSIPLLSFHKVKYLTLDFAKVLVEDVSETEKTSININKTLKKINRKTCFGFTSIDFRTVFSGGGDLNSQFGNDDIIKEAA